MHLPSISTPAMLSALDLSPERGERVFLECEADCEADSAGGAAPVMQSQRTPARN
ncbi:hypothetical protein QQM39_29670 [Streptomyces sp. DT2A-34]|uniref:hypothetical protein n=1 Tax=Streptomyces sp. DT2A-34 TaxID=3051182 RepID=UPI00265C7A57|nr:hypothetical protein [Streptomyces sp. DT2A-34]MDO0914848.1 hypothetical protein [Streptomyces sp. DT2A-34]